MAGDLNTSGWTTDDWAKQTQQNLTDDTAAQIRNSVSNAVGKNPAQEAQLDVLSKFTQTPVDAVREFPDAVKQQASMKLMDANKLATQSPVLAKFLTIQQNANMSHDDIPNLAGVEQSVQNLNSVIPQDSQLHPNAPDNLTPLSANYSWGQTVSNRLRGYFPQQVDKVPGFDSEILPQFASKFSNSISLGLIPDIAGEAQTGAGTVAGGVGQLAGFLGGPLKMTEGLMSKLGIDALKVGAGDSFVKAFSKTVLSGAATLGAATGLDEAGNALNSPDLNTAVSKEAKATASGAEMGATFGAAGRLLPGGGLPQFLLRFAGTQAALDAEQGKTPFQDVTGWADMDPNQKVNAVFNMGLNAFFSRHGAGSTEGGLFHDKVTETAANEAKAQQADAVLSNIQKLSQFATQSKLRENNVQAFHDLVQKMSDNGEASDVYISAKDFGDVLNQTGLTADDIQKNLPNVADQFHEAEQTNGYVRIPVADYASTIAGSPLDAAIQPHLKMSPDGMTQKEAQAFYQSQQEDMQKQADTIVDEKKADAVYQADVQNVHDKVLDQLKGANRFRPDVNEAYATLARNFYVTKAEQLGMKPSEVYDRYPLKVASDDTGGFNEKSPLINVGLNVNDGSKITPEDVKTALGRVGVRVVESKTHQSNTEPTMVAALDRELTPEEAHKVSVELKQDAIAQVSGGKGGLYGPHTENYGGEFNPDYFLGMDGDKYHQRLVQPDSVDVKGTHFSKEQRTSLTGRMYGTGARGAESQRLNQPGVNPDLRNRISFYVDEGKGVFPETGVGNKKHEVPLTNMYDGAKNPRKFPTKDSNTFEDAVVKAGYDGYYVRNGFGRQGVAVLLGDAAKNVSVPGEYSQSASLTLDGKPAADGWATATKIKRDGAPITVYHGGDRAMGAEIFDNLGKSTGNAISGLGAQFTENKKEAGVYGDTVEPFNLDIRNPKVVKFNSSELDFKNAQVAADYRKQLESEGYDGLLVKDPSGPGTAHVIAFRPDQIVRPNGYNQSAQTETPEFKKWSKGNTLVTLSDSTYHPFQDGEGVVVEALHGTTGDFTAFDKTRASKDSDLGGGFYFTNSEEDVGNNYAGEGPDLTSRIQLKAEQIASDTDREYDDPEVLKEARDLLAVEHGGMAMPVYIRFNKPVVLGGSSETFLDYRETYNSRTDEYGEPKGKLVRFIEALNFSAQKYYDADLDTAIANLRDEAEGREGLTASDAISALKRDEDLTMATDSEDNLIGIEIIREAFEKMGYDGIIDQTVNDKFGDACRVGQAMAGVCSETVHYIAFKPTQIKSAIGNRGTFNRTDNILHASDKLGSFNPDTLTIGLLKDANLSTFLHETGHFFLEATADMASRPDAPQQIKDDFDATMRYLGVDPAKWGSMSLEQKRDYHEKFARSFEAYLFEGKSPTLEMQSVFSRFSAWLKHVYQSISSLGVQLTPEVRQVFDRMIASQDAVDSAEKARSYTPLFKTAEEAGVSPEEFAKYAALGTEATQQAIADMQKRSLRDMQWLSNAKSRELRKLQRQSAGVRKDIEQQVTKEVMDEPVNKARIFLTKGEIIDPATGDLIKAEKGFKLNTQDVKTLFPESELAHPDMSRLQGMTSPEGLHPDLIAEMFGFPNGKALVRELITSDKPADQIEGMTDQRMLEEHGELTDPNAIERAAEAAIHNEARAKFMATGLKVLTKSPIPASQIAKAAEEAARAAVAAKIVKELNPKPYLAAETRSNKEALKLAPKDPKAAADEQRAALLNNRLAKASSDAVDYVKKGVTYVAKFNKASIRDKIDLDVRDQIDDLLSRFDFRKTEQVGPTRPQRNLAEWVQSQIDAGYSPNVPADMLNPLVRKNYQRMTFEQFSGLIDTLRALEKIGRDRRSFILNGKRQNLDEYVKDVIVPKLQERGERFSKDELLDKPEDRYNNKLAIAFDHLNSFRRAAAAQLLPMRFTANEYDRHELMGPFHEAIIDPVIEANYNKVRMLKGLSEDFKKQGELLGRKWQDSLREEVDNKYLIDPDKSTAEQKVPMHFNRGKMLGVALHVGNESNFNKLTRGWGWDPVNVWRFLHENMTAKDWQATQAVWDLYEKHWPEMEQMNRDLGNTVPEKITPRAFKTPFGEMRGGYAAITYDSIRSRRGEKEAQGEAINPDKGLFGRDYYRSDTTSNGSLNKRIDTYVDRVGLDFHDVAKKLHETIHDLAFRRTLIDVNKIIENPKFREEFKKAYGREKYQSLRDWLGGIANSDNYDRTTGALGKFLQYTRTGMVLNAIAFRASTVLKHGGSAGIKTAGFFVGGGEKYLASRMASMSYDYTNQIESAKEKFGEIAQRLTQQDRDFRETSSSMFEPESATAKATRFGHAAVAWGDMMTAVPTAWAAYDRAITEGIPKSQGGTGKPMTEEQAVRYANSLVGQAHGSTAESARSPVMNSRSEAIKMFTVLYNFMNTSYGQQLDGYDKLRTAGISNAPVLARTLMAIVVPAMWAWYLTSGGPSKNNEGWPEWMAKAISAEVAASVPFVRDAYSMAEGYSHAGLVGAENWISTMVAAGKGIATGKGKPVRDISNAVGMGLHIPGLGQAGSSAQYLIDINNGTKKKPDNMPEMAKGVILGR